MNDHYLRLIFSTSSLHCFCVSAITYKVVIVTGKQLGGSTTTANVWMILAGEIKDTGIIDVPKGDCEFRFQVRSELTLFILNSSISSKLFFLEVQ